MVSFIVLCVSIIFNVHALRALRRCSLLLVDQTSTLYQVKGDIAEVQEIVDRVSHRRAEDARLLARVVAELESVKIRVGAMGEQGTHAGHQLDRMLQEMRRALQSREVTELIDSAERD